MGIDFLKSSTTVIFSGSILNNSIWRHDEHNDQVNHDIITIKILFILYCLFFRSLSAFQIIWRRNEFISVLVGRKYSTCTVRNLKCCYISIKITMNEVLLCNERYHVAKLSSFAEHQTLLRFWYPVAKRTVSCISLYSKNVKVINFFHWQCES